MTILHKMFPDGGFIAADEDTGVTCYACPTSTYATQAKRHASAVAAEMIAGELATGCPRAAGYDDRNWKILAVASVAA